MAPATDQELRHGAGEKGQRMTPATARKAVFHPTETDPSYTSEDLVRIFGTTHRQLQWWDERNVIMPHIENHRRVYSTHLATLVGVVHRLRATLSLQAIRTFVPRIERGMARNAGRFLVLALPKSLYFANEPELIVAALAEFSAPSVVVDLRQITDALKEHK